MTKFTATSGTALLAAAICGVGLISMSAIADGRNDVAIPANALTIADIESRMAAQGISIKEVEMEGLLVEVEGFDTNGNKVELVLDRRSGEILSRKVKTRRK